MIERKTNFISRQFAKLLGYKLVFNKKASSGNFFYANIIPAVNDFVEGALYNFSDKDIGEFDKAEGYPKHYDKIELIVNDEDNNSILETT